MENVIIRTFRKTLDVDILAGKRYYVRGTETVERGTNENGTERKVCKPHPVKYNGDPVYCVRVNPVANHATGKVIRGLHKATIISNLRGDWYLDDRDNEWHPAPSYDESPEGHAEALAHSLVWDSDGERQVTIYTAFIDATAYKELRKLVKHSNSAEHFDYGMYENWLKDIFG